MSGGAGQDCVRSRIKPGNEIIHEKLSLFLFSGEIRPALQGVGQESHCLQDGGHQARKSSRLWFVTLQVIAICMFLFIGIWK